MKSYYFSISNFYLLIVVIGLTLIGFSCSSGSDSGTTTTTTTTNSACLVNDDILPSGVTNFDLAGEQWHLVNDGTQNAYASTTGTNGMDINQTTTYGGGNKGDGIIVAIIDEGLEVFHEDLSPNVVSGGSWDFKCNDNNPTNVFSSSGDHGTSVAGLVAAADNGLGGRGVAPEAELKGFNFLQTQLYSEYVDSIGGSSSAPISNDVDIFNMSFGYSKTDDFLVSPTIEAAFQYGVNSLRDGKGAIYVKSAGNGFIELKGGSECTAANAIGVSCQNANMDPESALPYIIVVGATNADGEKTSYSTVGANLLISAPGGEYGYDSTYGWSGDAKYFKPAMITTDQMGCNRGYSDTNDTGKNRLEDNNNGLNPNCDYTSTFNGTSSAAPVLSGAIALILKVKPTLTWRDVRHILITTAQQIPNTAGHGETTAAIGGGTYVLQDDWVTNTAGHEFHNWYGFGQLDVDAATSAAVDQTADNFGNYLTTGWDSDNDISDDTIEDNNISGASDSINITETYIVETVQIKISLTHSYTGNLGIELNSPDGTRSVLLNARNGFSSSDDLANMILTSNAFYGEAADGDWILKVVDADGSSSNLQGTLTSWSIKIFGHAP